MDTTIIAQMMANSAMISIDQAMNIFHLLVSVLEIPGDVVELGCYEGQTGALIQKILDEYGSSKDLYLYDSFCGLPDKSPEDGPTDWKKGRFAVGEDAVVENFENWQLKQPHIVKGFFQDTLPASLPDQIAFAHLDGDFYSSIIESLEHVYPRLTHGAVVVIDDYCDPGKIASLEDCYNMNAFSSGIVKIKNDLPGVKAACDKFLEHKLEKVEMLIARSAKHGYFKKGYVRDRRQVGL